MYHTSKLQGLGMRLSYCLGYLEYNRNYPYIHNIPVHTSNCPLSDLCVRCLPSNHTVVSTHLPWREIHHTAVIGTHYDSRACTVSDTYILCTPIQDSELISYQLTIQQVHSVSAVHQHDIIHFMISNDPIMNPLYIMGIQ